MSTICVNIRKCFMIKSKTMCEYQIVFYNSKNQNFVGIINSLSINHKKIKFEYQTMFND